jgi:hypothetical protein
MEESVIHESLVAFAVVRFADAPRVVFFAPALFERPACARLFFLSGSRAIDRPPLLCRMP